MSQQLLYICQRNPADVGAPNSQQFFSWHSGWKTTTTTQHQFNSFKHRRLRQRERRYIKKKNKRLCYLCYTQYQRTITGDTFTIAFLKIMRPHFRTSDIPWISTFVTFPSQITSPTFDFNIINWHYGSLSDPFEVKLLFLAPSLELLAWSDNIILIMLQVIFYKIIHQ